MSLSGLSDSFLATGGILTSFALLTQTLNLELLLVFLTLQL